MSYSIYIGQAEIEFDRECPERKLRVGVAEVERDDAPQFENDRMTGKSNNRHPSYTGWGEFIRRAGIEDLFYNDKTGLMREHPGCFLLTESHYVAIKSALDAWNAAHPNTVPGFAPNPFAHRASTGMPLVVITDAPESAELDHTKARLMWLEWWVRWALDNCSIPAICNW